MKYTTVLSIAGSDPSAGAGIQQDLKTITAHGCYGATVLTAITAQNTMGVQEVMPIPSRMVGSQLRAVLSDLEVHAIKIGMIPTREATHAIVTEILPFAHLPLVYDPVMVSTSGRSLMDDNCLDYLTAHLFPRCTLITPNLPEATRLLGRPIASEADILQAGRDLASRYRTHVLIKGGHDSGTMMTDRLFTPRGETYTYSSSRISSTNLHGTGCVLSSAIASRLALGFPMGEAIQLAKDFISEAIANGVDAGIGKGNGPVIVRAMDH